MPPPLHAVMEHLWSRADATDVNRRQGCSRAKRPGYLQTAASGCIPLPPTLDGKEGVDGSSPSEGSAKAPHVGAFLVQTDLLFVEHAVGMEPFMELSRSERRRGEACLG